MVIKKATTLKKHSKLDLIYDSKHNFHKYHDIKKFDNFSLNSEYYFLADIFNDLDKFSKLKTEKEEKKRKKKQMCMIQLQHCIATC